MKKSIQLSLFLVLSITQVFAQFDITFELNTALIANEIDPTGIYLAGGAGFGVAGDNLMTDPDGDGIYTITVQRDAGFSSFYTFLNGNCADWSCKEDIAGLPCSDPLNFNDRFLPEVTGDMTIKACYGNCADDGTCDMNTDSISITFQLNTATITVDPEGVYVAGGGAFGNPGDNLMTDPDGDGTYTITIDKPVGFSGFYTYANGNCPDYSCKENLAGLPCADPANFNDRFMSNVTQDTTILACYGTCEDTGNCTIVTDSIQITFELNTENIQVDPTGIYIAGGSNFGVPGDNPMVDPEGDGIYTYTTTRPVGFASYYSFFNGNCPDWTCKEDLAGKPCADPVAFNDRFLDATTENTTVQACFGNCASDGSCISAGVNSLEFDPTLFDIVPTITQNHAEFRFGNHTRGLSKQILITDVSGRTISVINNQLGDVHTVDVTGYATGVYIARVQVADSMFAKKFIVQ